MPQHVIVSFSTPQKIRMRMNASVYQTHDIYIFFWNNINIVFWIIPVNYIWVGDNPTLGGPSMFGGGSCQSHMSFPFFRSVCLKIEYPLNPSKSISIYIYISI